MTERFFKGWAKPGPVISNTPDLSPLEGVEGVFEEVTCDALSGFFRLHQLKKGHRFSTDDLLVAWYGTTQVSCARRVLDLGSGIGTVGMISAWRLQGAQFVTVEAQSQSVALAKRSAHFNELESRYEIREGDFRDPGVLYEDEKFDLITGSPPYFPMGSGALGDHPQKIACRFEVRGNIAAYCETAAKHLTFGGVFACIFPLHSGNAEVDRKLDQWARVREGAEAAGLVIVKMRPIVLREGDPALLAVCTMMRGDHLPEAVAAKARASLNGALWIEPDLIIRKTDGQIHPEYSCVKMSIGFRP